MLVDDHAMFRWGVRHFLEGLTDYQLVGEASDGNEALSLLRTTDPDILFLDLEMPGLDGPGFLRHLQQEFMTRTPKVIVLSQSSSAALCYELKQAGISGYVLKSEGIDEITKALEATRKGEFYVSPRVAIRLWEFIARNVESALPQQTIEPENKSISAREMQVAQLIGRGLSNKLIAEELGCAVNTVKTHRANLMHKIGAKNAVDVARWAVRNGGKV